MLKLSALSQSLLLGFILRILLIVYSVYHDARSSLKYTDIDYFVFTDSAEALLNPNSNSKENIFGFGNPYARDTYRYTPFLALLLTPNLLFLKEFGKVLFAISDLVVGYLIVTSLTSKLHGQSSRKTLLLANTCWIINPMVMNISTRGSSEGLLGVLIWGSLILTEWDRWDAAALLWGFSVHWKIFPIIFGSSLLARLKGIELECDGKERKTWAFYLKPTATQVRFAALSFLSFLISGLLAYIV
jgi:GPI mannosyltransferase 1 subunit M